MKSDQIRRVPLFASLADEEVLSLAHVFIEKRYSRNQVIFMEEDTGNYMYIVLSGKLKISKTTESGKESILAIHQPGDFFGEMSLLDGKTSPATVSAMEDCRILSVGKADFHNHLMRHEKVVQQIIQVLCSRLRQVWTQVQVLSYSTAETRIRAGLHQLARRHGVQDARGILINLKITHQEMAEMFGTSRETVTRSLARLREQKLIAMDGRRIVVLELKALLPAGG